MEKRPADLIIYRARNVLNGNSYIGATSGSLKVRRAKHLSDANGKRPGCRIFNSAIRKYGEAAFEWTVLANSYNYADLMATEVSIIAQEKPEYNCTRGGQGMIGLIRTPEWTEKIAAALRGRKPSEQTIKKMMASRNPAANFKGVVCLDDGIRYSSVKGAASYYKISDGRISEVLARRQHHTGGHRFEYASIVDSIGLDAAIAVRDGLKLASERSLKEGRKNRPVVCVNDGITYKGGKTASRAYGVSQMTVSRLCCIGGATNGGLKFRFADRDEVIRRTKTKEEMSLLRERQNIGVRKAIEKRKKKVICLDDGVVYDSLSNAARAYNLRFQDVSSAIKRSGKCHGKVFQFVEKD